jgi:hypothetical protein
MPFNQEVFEIVVPDIGWGQLEQGNELGFLLIPFLDQFLDLLDASAQRRQRHRSRQSGSDKTGLFACQTPDSHPQQVVEIAGFAFILLFQERFILTCLPGLLGLGESLELQCAQFLLETRFLLVRYDQRLVNDHLNEPSLVRDPVELSSELIREILLQSTDCSQTGIPCGVGRF